jgi:hypothetical protein
MGGSIREEFVEIGGKSSSDERGSSPEREKSP